MEHLEKLDLPVSRDFEDLQVMMDYLDLLDFRELPAFLDHQVNQDLLVHLEQEDFLERLEHLVLLDFQAPKVREAQLVLQVFLVSPAPLAQLAALDSQDLRASKGILGRQEILAQLGLLALVAHLELLGLQAQQELLVTKVIQGSQVFLGQRDQSVHPARLVHKVLKDPLVLLETAEVLDHQDLQDSLEFQEYWDHREPLEQLEQPAPVDSQDTWDLKAHLVQLVLRVARAIEEM